jgi:hypothetical protein
LRLENEVTSNFLGSVHPNSRASDERSELCPREHVRERTRPRSTASGESRRRGLVGSRFAKSGLWEEWYQPQGRSGASPGVHGIAHRHERARRP